MSSAPYVRIDPSSQALSAASVSGTVVHKLEGRETQRVERATVDDNGLETLWQNRYSPDEQEEEKRNSQNAMQLKIYFVISIK